MFKNIKNRTKNNVIGVKFSFKNLKRKDNVFTSYKNTGQIRSSPFKMG